MPGIAGIISKSSSPAHEERLSRMLACKMHENFYTSGTYTNHDIGLYIGWVNIKGSFSHCNPIWNERRDLFLIFSGEVYSDSSVREWLKSKGHTFKPSDASYLIHLYEELGDKFFETLNGRFHGVLVDQQAGEVALFNDRYGMQRIYFCEDKEAFYFSSEAKSLLTVKPELRKLDFKGLGELFCLGCVLENRTLFKNIALLPCGSRWTFRYGHAFRKESYFQTKELEQSPILCPEPFYREFKDTFAKILPRYFDSREPIGMSLTGGLDTRMIMAHMDLVPGQMPCYTFSGMYRECADSKIACKVAEACLQPHQIVRLDGKFLSVFPELAEKTVYVTDGNQDVSGSPDLYVNRIARGIAPIRMTGNYGQEVINHSRAFKPDNLWKDLFVPEFLPYIHDARNEYAEITKEHPLSFNLTKQAPWHHFGRFALEQSQLTVRSPYLDNDLVRLLYQAPPETIADREISLRLVNDGNPSLGVIRTDRGVGGSTNSVFSMVARLFHEATFKAEYAYDYGMPHWLAKLDTVLKPLRSEKIFLGNHKFYHFRTWYANELSAYVKDVLLDGRTTSRSYFRKRSLEKMVNGHVRGKYNFTTEIHKALTAELVCRSLVDQ